MFFGIDYSLMTAGFPQHRQCVIHSFYRLYQKAMNGALTFTKLHFQEFDVKCKKGEDLVSKLLRPKQDLSIIK